MQDTPGAELERVEAQAPDIARPVISPEEAERMVSDLRQLIARILVENKHYQKFRGKDVLLKAGAEELGKFFGLSSGYEDLKVQQVEVESVWVWSASVKCSVSNQAGRILAESYGFYSGDERRKRDGTLDAQPANTIVKMAQKRAYVGAILTATGTSELFTQDIEDTAAAGAPAASAADRLPTDAEKNALCALFAEKGARSMEEAQAWLIGKGAKGESFAWVATTAMGLLTREGGAGPNTEPELVPEPPLGSEAEALAAAEVVDGEVVNDEDIPF